MKKLYCSCLYDSLYLFYYKLIITIVNNYGSFPKSETSLDRVLARNSNLQTLQDFSESAQ